MTTEIRNWLNGSLLAVACLWCAGSANAQVPGLYKDGVLVEPMPDLLAAANEPLEAGKVRLPSPVGKPSGDTVERSSASRDCAAVVEQIRVLIQQIQIAGREPSAEELQQIAILRDQINAAATRIEQALAAGGTAQAADAAPDADEATLLALAMKPEILDRQRQSIQEMQRNKEQYLAALDVLAAGQSGGVTAVGELTDKLFPKPVERLPDGPTIRSAARIKAPRLTREQADDLLHSQQSAAAKTNEPQTAESPQQAPAPVPQDGPQPAPPDDAPPVPADLAETVEIQFTPEITAKAAALGNSTLAIYEFVRNKVEFQPYLGSRKGAAGTLRQLHGNDTDQAALLMALLRVSGVPCRYVRGTVEMTPTQATKWLGVDDPGIAGNILTTAGLDGVNIIGGSTVTAIRCTRVWVEAYIPYTNYRGIPSDNTGKTWIPLDPAWHGTVVTPGEDVLAAMGFNTDTYLANYISTFHPASPVEKLAADIQAWLDVNDPGKTVADIERNVTMDQQRLGLLPASIPGRTLAVASRFSTLEDHKRYKVRFHLHDGGTNFIDHTLNLSDLANRQLTIDYVGATSVDQAVIDSHGGIYQTPPNLVNVKSRLKLDGNVLVTSPNAIGMGRTHDSDMQFLQPVGDDNVQPLVENAITAGNGQAIAFNTFFDQNDGFLFGGNAPALSFLETQLHGTAADYLGRVDRGIRQTGRLMRVATTQDVSEAIVESSVSVTTSFGVPVTFEWTGLTVDADRRIIGTFPVDGDFSKEVPFMLLSGYEGSIQENRVFEDIYDQEAVSTIKILELSNDSNIPVYRITTSIAQDAPGLSQSSSIVSAINNALAQGHHVVIPRTPITVGLWQGTGYIDLDPLTGAAGYIISGGISGGFISNGGATVQQWPVNLTCPVKDIRGEVTTPAKDSPEPEGVFCASDDHLTFEVKLIIVCDDGTPAGAEQPPLMKTLSTNLTRQQIIKQYGTGDYTLSVPGYPSFTPRIISLLEIDIDVDSNMDGNPDNDDANETDLKGIVVNVNNDGDGGGIDSHDKVINGASDKPELTPLNIRKLPVRGLKKLTISVDHKEWVRIFDQNDNAIIGPPNSDGGPDKDKHDIPEADFQNELNFLVEAFNHGHVIVTLTGYDKNDTELCKDEVRLVCNVDRTPSGGAVRFRINALKSQANMEGIQAMIATPKAKVNWVPTIRMFSSTNVWVSAQKNDISNWMQTGLAIDRNVGGSPVSAIYAEIKHDAGRLYEFKKTGGATDDWPLSALFKIEIADLTTGKTECSLDGTVFALIVRPEFKTAKMDNYQIGSEMFHSVDQQPGKSTDKCTVSGAKVKVSNVWTSMALSAGDVKLSDYDKSGNNTNPASSHEWEFSDVTATGFKLWDKVVE